MLKINAWKLLSGACNSVWSHMPVCQLVRLISCQIDEGEARENVKQLDFEAKGHIAPSLPSQ